MSIETLKEGFAAADAAFERKRFFEAKNLRRALQDDVEKATSYRQHGKPVSEKNNVRASIIILSHIDDDLISQALSRVASQLEDDFEVVLVSNGNDRIEERGRKAFERFTYVDIPLNAGCSMGRNIAARRAKGDWIVFLEDDGLIEPGCIDALLRCSAETGAVMVRGRYRSLTGDPGNDPAHYDIGDYRRYFFANCEGVSCARREDFLLFDGFDPVLAGHEGVELCARMWRFYGPRGFMYEPDAVLLHDYAASTADIAVKLKRQSAFKEYVDVVTPNTMHLHNATVETVSLSEGAAAWASIEARFASLKKPADVPKISVVTTARNGENWLKDYVQCWSRQEYSNFEVIFVDDGSDDNTHALMQEVARDDDRYIVIKGPGSGRSAALNTAIEYATGTILAIADVDDVATPDRLSLTAKYFLTHPEVDLLSFTVYGERFMSWAGGRPTDNRFGDLATRSLLGMPGRFPTYAFRREFARVPFDTNLTAGIDYAWVCQNQAAMPSSAGVSVPIPTVYYRQHAQSITNNNLAEQQSVREATIRSVFERLIGPLSEKDTVFIEAFSRNSISDPRFDAVAYLGWVDHLLALNGRTQCFEPRALEYTLIRGFNALIAAGKIPATNPGSVNTESASLDPYTISKAVMTRVHSARVDGNSIRALKLLRQFRAGARGVVFETIYAEAASFLRRLRNGLIRIFKFLTLR